MPRLDKNDTSAAPGEEQLLKYELTDIELLKPAERNSRKHPDAQLAALTRSMEAYGVVSPVIRDANNRILAGHARVQAAKEMGWKSIATLQLPSNWSDQDARLLAIADNRIAEMSVWDETARAEEFQALRLEVPDLDLTLSGFEHPRIELGIASLEQTSWSDLDEVPEVERPEPVTRLGDVFEFGADHVLLCGDSTLSANVAAVVGEEKIQLVEQDFPYNLKAKEYSGKGKNKHGDFAMGAGEMSKAEFREFLSASFEAIKPSLMDGALFYGWMDWKHVGDLFESGEGCGLELKNLVVWDKGKGGMGALYRSAHELVAVFKHGRGKHTNNVMLGKHGRDRHNIWRYPGMNRFGRGRDRALSLHGTVKPVEMICDLLLDASNPGDIVFDGFLGSGTTLIAAEKLGRRARVIELDPRYCDVAIERFIHAFGIEPVERATRLSFSELAERRSAEAGDV